MARSFNGSSDYLRASGSPVTAVPLSMSCWSRHTNNATNLAFLVGVFNSASGDLRNSFSIQRQPSAGTARAATGDDATAAVDSVDIHTFGEGAGVWHHVGGVFSAVNSREVFGNGTGGEPQTTSRTPSGIDRFAIGRQDNASATLRYWEGDIAEAAIWDVALTAAEMVSLASGASPLLIRPANLLVYCPLWGNSDPEPDFVGGYNLTVTGATKADHSRILYPTKPRIFLPAAAPAFNAATFPWPAQQPPSRHKIEVVSY